MWRGWEEENIVLSLIKTCVFVTIVHCFFFAQFFKIVIGNQKRTKRVRETDSRFGHFHQAGFGSSIFEYVQCGPAQHEHSRDRIPSLSLPTVRHHPRNQPHRETIIAPSDGLHSVIDSQLILPWFRKKNCHKYGENNLRDSIVGVQCMCHLHRHLVCSVIDASLAQWPNTGSLHTACDWGMWHTCVCGLVRTFMLWFVKLFNDPNVSYSTWNINHSRNVSKWPLWPFANAHTRSTPNPWEFFFVWFYWVFIKLSHLHTSRVNYLLSAWLKRDFKPSLCTLMIKLDDMNHVD